MKNSLFENCAKLKYLDIPSSVKEIKFNAFKNCKSLEGISLRDTLSTIPGSYFLDCTSLKKFKWKVSPEVQETHSKK